LPPTRYGRERGQRSERAGREPRGGCPGGRLPCRGCGQRAERERRGAEHRFRLRRQGGRHTRVDNEAIETAFAAPLTGEGFRILGNAGKPTSLKLVANTAERNAGTGFRIALASRLRLDKNGAIQNGGFGFLLTGVSESQVVGSVARLNARDGIRVTESSITEKLVVTKSLALGHASPDFDLRDDSPTCAGTRWEKNEFGRAFPDCVN
jgi:hypothetical protein